MRRLRDELKVYLELHVFNDRFSCSLRERLNQCRREGNYWILALSDDDLELIMETCFEKLLVLGCTVDPKDTTSEGAMLQRIVDLLSEEQFYCV